MQITCVFREVLVGLKSSIFSFACAIHCWIPAAVSGFSGIGTLIVDHEGHHDHGIHHWVPWWWEVIEIPFAGIAIALLVWTAFRVKEMNRMLALISVGLAIATLAVTVTLHNLLWLMMAVGGIFQFFTGRYLHRKKLCTH